jgi:hypothetical protein
MASDRLDADDGEPVLPLLAAVQTVDFVKGIVVGVPFDALAVKMLVAAVGGNGARRP